MFWQFEAATCWNLLWLCFNIKHTTELRLDMWPLIIIVCQPQAVRQSRRLWSQNLNWAKYKKKTHRNCEGLQTETLLLWNRKWVQGCEDMLREDLQVFWCFSWTKCGGVSPQAYQDETKQDVLLQSDSLTVKINVLWRFFKQEAQRMSNGRFVTHLTSGLSPSRSSWVLQSEHEVLPQFSVTSLNKRFTESAP